MENSKLINTDDSLITKDENFKTHWRSKYIIITFFWQNFLLGTFTFPFQAVSQNLQYTYNIKSSMVSLTGSLVSLSFILFSIPLTFFNKKYNLKKSLLLGNLLFIIGCIFNLFVNISYNFIIIGFFIIGCGIPLILNSQLTLVKNWVKPSKRNLINGISAVFSPIGSGIGPIFPTLFLDIENVEEENQKYNFFNYLIMILWINIGVFIITIIFIRDNPPKGYGNLNKEKDKTMDFSLKMFLKENISLIKNKTIVSSILIYGLSLTVITVLGSCFNDLLYPFTDNQEIILILTIITILSGLLGSIFYSIFFQNKLNTLYSLSLLFFISILSILLIIISLMFDIFYMNYFAAFWLGSSVFSHIPVIFEYIILKFNKNNFFILNSLFTFTQQFSQAILVYVYSYILENKSKDKTLFCFISFDFILIICMILIFFI